MAAPISWKVVIERDLVQSVHLLSRRRLLLDSFERQASHTSTLIPDSRGPKARGVPARRGKHIGAYTVTPLLSSCR
jgi:hypothetical protein